MLELISPAKVNLSLAILGRRVDGFHSLNSIAAQTDFGDLVTIQWDPDATGPDEIRFSNIHLSGTENSLSRAVREFRSAAGLEVGRFSIHCDKRIPVGAGLGGGSSNAATVLHAVRRIFGSAVRDLDWPAIAARIGSDCPLFLEDRPVIMQGRGELIEKLPLELSSRLSGKALILFKPAFSINTSEAYTRLAGAGFYQKADVPQKILDEWSTSGQLLPRRCNDFERLVDYWIPSIAVVLDRLRRIHELDARLSGSGSACFIFPNELDSANKVLNDELTNAWGSSYWIQRTCLK